METFIASFWTLWFVAVAILVRIGWEIGGAIWRKLGG